MRPAFYGFSERSTSSLTLYNFLKLPYLFKLPYLLKFASSFTSSLSYSFFVWPGCYFFLRILIS